ncbi:MAG: hypothetical protein P1P88_24385 [Bacteroidales bacterium]|nr:hypothetical protein [Bacteroidales bacterium]
MLRKTINIIMTVVFMISTMGFTISKHYCGNELVNFSIDSQAKTCCDMENGCCHTEEQHFQVKENFVGAAFAADLTQVKTDLLFPICFLSIDCKTIEFKFENLQFEDLPPPPKIQKTLSKLQTYLC